MDGETATTADVIVNQEASASQRLFAAHIELNTSISSNYCHTFHTNES